MLNMKSWIESTILIDHLRDFGVKSDNEADIGQIVQQCKHRHSNLMFFWPCFMNWLYINHQLDALIIIYS